MSASDRIQLIIGQLNRAGRVFGQFGPLFFAQALPELGILPRTDNFVQ